MTAKRFTIQGQSIKHNDELLTLDMVCEMLNDYAEENMMLKGEVAHYKLILMSLEKEAKRITENWKVRK